jgi:hypothetical protein
MFIRPFLAKCNDRAIKAKHNAIAGSPEDWFTSLVLSQFGLMSVSFDFFVNWELDEISPEIWIKRLVNPAYTKHRVSLEDIQNGLDELEGTSFRETFVRFATQNRFSPKFLYWRESNNWHHEQSRIVKISFDAQANCKGADVLNLSMLMDQIRTFSGGPVSIGKKGLFYGTSTLECFLSQTDALWPGDVDQIWIDQNYHPVAILEFKKHNLSTPIQNQCLSNYYPRPDARKYNRLAILRDYFQKEVPLLVLYYSTNPSVSSIKVEMIRGSIMNLTSVNACLLNSATMNDIDSHVNIVRNILTMISRG